MSAAAILHPFVDPTLVEVGPSSDTHLIEPFKEAKQAAVEEFERAYLTRLLARTGKNVTLAAALAGVERQSIRALLRRHGLRSSE